MPNNLVTLHRAFTEPNAMASWFPPYGFVCEVHKMEAKIGSHYKMEAIILFNNTFNSLNFQFMLNRLLKQCIYVSTH